MPEGANEYTTTVSYDFGEEEPLPYLQLVETIKSNEWDIPSTALRKVEFPVLNGITNIRIKPCNGALESVRCGGSIFMEKQTRFDFVDLPNLRDVFLVMVMDAKVTLKNCPRLETFATSRTIWKPEETYLNEETLIAGAEADEEYGYIPKANKEFPPIIRDSLIIAPPEYKPWPYNPEPIYSLSDENGKGLTIVNCPALRTISLDHTRINELDLQGMPDLAYLYLSSDESYIVGGGVYRRGEYLYNTIKTLPARIHTTPGMIVVRGFTWYQTVASPYFGPVKMNRVEMMKIDDWLEASNWSIVYDYGYQTV